MTEWLFSCEVNLQSIQHSFIGISLGRHATRHHHAAPPAFSVHSVRPRKTLQHRVNGPCVFLHLFSSPSWVHRHASMSCPASKGILRLCMKDVSHPANQAPIPKGTLPCRRRCCRPEEALTEQGKTSKSHEDQRHEGPGSVWGRPKATGPVRFILPLDGVFLSGWGLPQWHLVPGWNSLLWPLGRGPSISLQAVALGSPSPPTGAWLKREKASEHRT